MTRLIALTFSITFVLCACGGGGGSSSSGGNAAAVASCSQAPTLGTTTFGNGCFK